ncbi:retinol dehydrogenase 7 [Biomphalaria pfeifferi]|uniref:Retinol dehydrogenase 7 n=1 Tax=Biomphalaria pfeifferi TaxID=112525 RepID=A0AAD8BG52_BIOPF|nr:retinol dehydrogenase 7 [Biomphalaria pfeifferi]
MTDLWYVLVLLVITLFLIEYLRRRLTVGGYRGKYVLVTGCDSGFGQRLATRLDNLSFKVFAGCLTEDGRLYLSKNCSENVVPFLLDVRSNESIQSALDLVKQNLPKDIGLWGLVNNAGIVGNMAVSELCSKSDYLACFDVNLFGLIEMTRTFLPLLRRSKGRVVNTSSLLARLAVFAPVYTLSKCGVEVFSDFVRREMYSKGVQVSIIEPGAFKTPIFNYDTMTKAVQQAYDSASDEVQSLYSGFVSKYRQMMEGLDKSPKIDLVVDAYIHALTSRFPKARYAPSNDSSLLNIPLSYLPTWYTDWLKQY